MTQDILITPKSGEPQILFRASGTNDTPIYLNVVSDYLSANGSGSALIFEGQEGQLFSITDNLSSGVLLDVYNADSTKLFEVYASGNIIGCETTGNFGIGTGDPQYKLDINGKLHTNAYVTDIVNSGSISSAHTFDLDEGNFFHIVMTNNFALSVTGQDIGQRFIIRLQQDNTGSRTVTSWWPNIKWPGGSEPTLSTAANVADLLGFVVTSGVGSSYYYDGFLMVTGLQ